MRNAPAGALLVAALAICCREAAAPAPPASPPPAPGARTTALGAEPREFDFGRVLPDRSVRKEFRLRNLGRQEIAIESVTTDCGCVVAGEYDRRLPPGGSTTLTVLLQTPPEPGPVARSVIVRAAGPGAGTVELRLRATVVKQGRD